jgi:hypothetical protein
MGTEETFEVVATPSERWYLAVFLLRDGLKFKGKDAQKLWRFRVALGLVEPTEAFLQIKGAGDVPLAYDRQTKNKFTLSRERTEFLEECMKQVEPGGAELAMFQRLQAQIEDGKPNAEIDNALPFEASAEDWSPTLAPVIRQPGKLLDVLLDCLKTSDDFATFKAKLIEEATPQKPGKTTGGRLVEKATA